MPKLRIPGLKVLVHIGALLPLALLAWDITLGRFTTNPIEEITQRTGTYSLVLLVLSLVCTPISIAFGTKAVLQLRRPLGLYALMYAVLHTLNFVGLDYGFNYNLLREDTFGKVFIWVGVLALLSLLPLAVASSGRLASPLRNMLERLRWLAHLAAVLSVGHFLLLVKADLTEPLLYSAVVVVLLIVRIPAIRKVLSGLRAS
jgi:sulfoxide reductase heme-binding subunit YedZ